MTKTIMDLFELSEGKDLWVYLCDEDTHNEFEKQLLELAKEVGVYDSLKAKMNAYPISDRVFFKYHNLLDYYNLSGKLITRYKQYGPTACPDVLYIDFKKYMNGYEYPDYVMKQERHERGYKKISIDIENELYKRIMHNCVENHETIQNAILKALNEKF